MTLVLELIEDLHVCQNKDQLRVTITVNKTWSDFNIFLLL